MPHMSLDYINLHAVRGDSCTDCTWLAIEAAYEVREVVQHCQVMLHHDDISLGRQQIPDDLCAAQRDVRVRI